MTIAAILVLLGLSAFVITRYQAIRAFQSRQRRFGRVTTLHAEPEPISSAGE